MGPEHPPICDYEGSAYQHEFWEAGDRQYEDMAEAIALRRLLPERGEYLLEVGAGAGRNTPRYQGFSHIVLVDYSWTQLQQAQARLGRSERYIYVAADAYRLPFVPALFDTATMIRTLHHMAEPALALGQIRRVLRAGGVFILEFANKCNLKAIMRYLLKRQQWNPFSEESIEFVPLNFDFHPRLVRKWLADQAFTIERQLTVSHFRLALFKRLFPPRWLAAMDAAAQLTGDWWQLTPSVFVRSRVQGEAGTKAEGAFFCCPACGDNLSEDTGGVLPCQNCGRQWSFREGIYDFRLS